MRTDWYKRNGSRRSSSTPTRPGPHTPGPTAEAIEYLISKDITGWGSETIGTDAGKAGGMKPPFPAHNLMHKANRYGLASLCNLDRLPPKGAILIAAPLKIENGTGSPTRVLALVPKRLSAQRRPPMSEPDHIIVGSGINALVCAAMLAGKGAQGAGAGAQRPHRRLHPHRGDHRAGLRPRRDGDDLRAVHHLAGLCRARRRSRPARARVLPHRHADRRAAARRRARRVSAWTAPPTSPPSMRLRPATATSIARDVGEIERNAGLLFGLLGGGLWSWPTLQAAGRRGLAARAARPRRLPRRGADAGARLARKRATSRTLSRALWAPWVLHAGLGPEDAFSGQIAKVIAFALEAAGAPIVKGGAQNLLAAFEALIRERGGEIRTGADVASIVQANGRATGVRLASGEEISATKSVICSVTPTQLYERLLGGADAGERRRRGRRNTATARAISRSTTRWTGRRHGAARASARSRCCI